MHRKIYRFSAAQILFKHVANYANMKLLSIKNNDNLKFISNIEKIIWNSIEKLNPDEIFITRIDNWFDQKWLNFSGTIMHEISIWKEETTIPPFHPNRVESSKYYKKESEQYVEQLEFEKLHIYQNSTDNLKRKITDFTQNGILIWYSGNSKANEIGTLMCYLVSESECQSFFITLSGKKEWNVSQTKGILRKEIQSIIENKLNEMHSWQHRL